MNDLPSANPEPPPLHPDEVEVCRRVLQAIADDPVRAADLPQIKSLVAKVNRAARKHNRREHQTRRAKADQAIREQTSRCRAETVAALHGQPPPPTAALETDSDDQPMDRVLERPQNCYICKAPYREVHHHYHLLCPACAAFNFAKRNHRRGRGNRSDKSGALQGRIALVTGGRIKIGFEIVCTLLRGGAAVHITTRFPADAARRFAALDDFSDWADRLTIHAIDLRRLADVEGFAARFCTDVPHLDLLIHNAAQTVKRPLLWYRELLDGEALALPDELRALLGPRSEGVTPCLLEATGSAVPEASALSEVHELFPAGLRDHEDQALDLRPHNSWLLELDQVDTLELLEVHLVNTMAPFILSRDLKPALLASPFARRFIVNVSAMEGQFGRANKKASHPHTNMAKAALNMFTRTSASALAADGIFMNSVDTGWITQENPFPVKVRLREQGFVPPLDIIDGAARVLDPFFSGLDPEREPVWGQFLKDYHPHAW